MFEFFVKIKEHIKIWHVLLTAFLLFIITIGSVVIIMFSIPKFTTYLELQEMRKEVLWVETHAKLAEAYGPVFQKYPEYGKFIMYQQNDDLESIGK